MLSIFRKKSNYPLELERLHCDMHSHLIPGIDDGSPDMETSIIMIKAMIDLGYKKIITTPHIMWEMFKNTNGIIQLGCEDVKKKLADSKISIDFSAAAEYYMDDYFDKLLAADVPLLTIKDNLVLVEFSFIRQPTGLKEILFDMQIKGYQPVIAHPERYLYFNSHKNWYDEMKTIGCLFQLNLLSLSGYYGKGPVELSHHLIKKKYISLIGTDLHNLNHIRALKSASSTISDTVFKLLDSGMILNPHM